MKQQASNRLVAVVGGSGSGKSWLVGRLKRLLGENACHLSLDDFYRDRSHLPSRRREKINFDAPRAIDWPSAEAVLRDLRAGRPGLAPRYDFATHSRLPLRERRRPRPLVLIEGLWLLRQAQMRRLFDLKIFLDGAARLRLRRRLARDIAERGRTAESVHRQFREAVAPMHARYVEPQKKWADLILAQPFRDDELRELADRLLALLPDRAPPAAHKREAFRAELFALLKNGNG